MRHLRIGITALAAVLYLSGGCGGSDQSCGGCGPDQPDAGDSCSSSWVDSGFDQDAGLNGDGGRISAMLNARAALSMVANMSVDLDGDGRKELTRAVRACDNFTDAIDFDGDGQVDATWDYSPGGQIYRQFNDAGTVIFSRTMQAGDGGTFTVAQEADTNDDGRLDQRETYLLDPGNTQVAVKIERDTKYSGVFDLTANTTVPRAQEQLATATQVGGACSAAQLQTLQSAFDDAFLLGYDCLRSMSPFLAASFEYEVGRYEWNIECTQQLPSNVCARYDLLNYVARAVWGSLGGTVRPTIEVSPLAFTSSCTSGLQQPYQAAILFHEALHGVFGIHHSLNPGSDASDRVYGCERACFGSAPTSQDCAQCLAAKNSDNRCSQYPFKACSADPPAYCGCITNPTAYQTLSACAVDCPSGLACFASKCYPNGPCAP